MFRQNASRHERHESSAGDAAPANDYAASDRAAVARASARATDAAERVLADTSLRGADPTAVPGFADAVTGAYIAETFT